MGVRDVRKSEEIILTDGHPRGLHMKRRWAGNRYTFITLEHLLISLPPRVLRPVFLFWGREVGNIFYFRVKRWSVLEEEKVFSQRGDKRRWECETICQPVMLENSIRGD